MTKWEYLWKRSIKASDLDDAQKLGAEGWELVDVWEGIGYYKRPIPEKNAVSQAIAARRRFLEAMK